jgi:cyclohexanone monooxygenase
VLILAMGFDAFTGALLAMNPTGRDGVTLAEKWNEGPRTLLGIASEGFPNLFMITGPQSAVALYNNPLAIEDHVEFAADAIGHVLERGLSTIEPSVEAESDWVRMINEMADMTLFPRAESWYMGANIPGKPRGLLTFVGGAPAYRAICAEVVENDYRGFRLA